MKVIRLFAQRERLHQYLWELGYATCKYDKARGVNVFTWRGEIHEFPDSTNITTHNRLGVTVAPIEVIQHHAFRSP